jgi:hypothetical protein
MADIDARDLDRKETLMIISPTLGTWEQQSQSSHNSFVSLLCVRISLASTSHVEQRFDPCRSLSSYATDMLPCIPQFGDNTQSHVVMQCSSLPYSIHEQRCIVYGDRDKELGAPTCNDLSMCQTTTRTSWKSYSKLQGFLDLCRLENVMLD